MSNQENKGRAATGFDVGTSRIVVARQSEQGFTFESQLNAFVGIPYTRVTENALRQEHIPHSVEGHQILVHGNESERFADLLGTEVRRPMRGGMLNPHEPDSVTLIQRMSAVLLGDPQKGQKLCFTVPSPPVGAESDATYHETTLRQIFTGMGYEATSIDEGLAVVYSELADSNYTGIGISCGGGLCNVCFAYLSVPVLSFSISKAGDFVDTGAANVSGELTNRIRIVKEHSFHLNGHYADKVQQALGVYYDEMIHALVGAMQDAFARCRRTPKLLRPVPLVLSGGSALPAGFRDRVEKALRESSFPLTLSEIRMAADPLTSTAKGALIAALA